MKPAAFDYVRAEAVEEALAALAEADGEGRVLAGGQSLGPMLNLRLARPTVLVDITRLDDLKRLEATDDGLMLAAAVTQAELAAAPDLAARQPLLAEALPWIGHVQTRARGTVCGSLAHADPAAELPLIFCVQGGMAVARSVRGQRGVKAADFFQGMFETALEADELLYAVRFDPLPAGAGVAFTETAERHGDFAVVAIAAIADADGVTVGVGGVDDCPRIERWDGLGPEDVKDAVADWAAHMEPRSDPKADADYRRHLARALGARTVTRALERRDAV